MLKKLITSGVFIFIFAFPTVGNAVTTSELMTQISNLLRIVTSLQKQIQSLQTSTVTTSLPTVVAPVTTLQCPSLNRSLAYGSRGADVTSLQQFLRAQGMYTYSGDTGFFGLATQRAVQTWQRENGIVTSGTPYTTGYGVVGPRTRTALLRYCTTKDVTGTYPSSNYLKSVNTLGKSPLLVAFTTDIISGITSDERIYLNFGDGQKTELTQKYSNGSSYGGFDGAYKGPPLHITHTYIKPGTYSAFITSSASNYFSNIPAQSITVLGSTVDIQTIAPVVRAFSGPTTLTTQQTGTWSVSATTATNNPLYYSIDWGDEVVVASASTASMPILPLSRFVQRTTFTHAYTLPGVYTISITVRDARVGKEVRTTSTVRVSKSGTSSGTYFQVAPTSGNAPLTVSFTTPLTTKTGYAALDSGMTYQIKYGDGGSSKTLSRNGEVPIYTYKNPGTYIAILYSIPNTFGPYRFSGVLTRPTTPSEVGRVTVVVNKVAQSFCSSGGVQYVEGTTRDCIDTNNDGNQTCILDATYICRAGSWDIDGSRRTPNYPLPPLLKKPDSVTISVQPGTDQYYAGNPITATWNTTTNKTNVGMYVSLEEAKTNVFGKGAVTIKATKVNYRAGKTVIQTNTSCNDFFGDVIDATCTKLQKNKISGNTRYRVHAVLFTPANACLGGMCPRPNLGEARTKVLAEGYSKVFSIR